jgi:hypothetical protein
MIYRGEGDGGRNLEPHGVRSKLDPHQHHYEEHPSWSSGKYSVIGFPSLFTRRFGFLIPSQVYQCITHPNVRLRVMLVEFCGAAELAQGLFMPAVEVLQSCSHQMNLGQFRIEVFSPASARWAFSS